MLSGAYGTRDLMRWFHGQGFPVVELPARGISVKAGPALEPGPGGLWAVSGECSALVMVCPEWQREVEQITETLTVAELFSPFGTYELGRVTLPRGNSVWGPTWYFTATDASFVSCLGPRARRLSDSEQRAVDHDVFWHAVPTEDSVGFGIFKDDRLLALAEAYPRTERLWEIGLDVHPQATGRGLGSQVFSAAGCFVLNQGASLLARSAPWNVPSVRLLRRLGLQYALQDLTLMDELVRVPPQTLGCPLAGAHLRQYYPEWGMNREIEPRRP